MDMNDQDNSAADAAAAAASGTRWAASRRARAGAAAPLAAGRSTRIDSLPMGIDELSPGPLAGTGRGWKTALLLGARDERRDDHGVGVDVAEREAGASGRNAGDIAMDRRV